MKIERVSEHIWSLRTWIILPIHVWLVVDTGGITLVDAGIPWMARGILKAVERLNAGPLKRILLTHGHSDHVGAVESLVNSTGVPVYAHAIELPYLNGELPYPRRSKAAPSMPVGLAQPLEGKQPDSLDKVAGLRPYLTPGHSPGHVAYYHEQDQVLLAGDLFTSKNGKLRSPMAIFTADMAEAVRSAEVVELLKPKRVEVCHGDSVIDPVSQYDAYRRSMAAHVSV